MNAHRFRTYYLCDIQGVQQHLSWTISVHLTCAKMLKCFHTNAFAMAIAIGSFLFMVETPLPLKPENPFPEGEPPPIYMSWLGRGFVLIWEPMGVFYLKGAVVMGGGLIFCRGAIQGINQVSWEAPKARAKQIFVFEVQEIANPIYFHMCGCGIYRRECGNWNGVRHVDEENSLRTKQLQ